MSRETADTQEYVSILSSDGTFRLPVAEGTPGAVRREWSVDDKTGVKNELVYKSLSGKITKVDIVAAEFGTLLQVDITDDEGTLTISTNASNNFGIDLMKKLPAMKMNKEYRLAPFSFIDKTGKSKKGVSITEVVEGKDSPKVENYFYDKDKKEEKNGFPTPEGDTTKYTKNKWKAYFGTVEDFLVEYTKNETTKNIIDPLAEDNF